MLRAVIADLHLGQASGDLERFSAAVAELRARGVGELVLLGDLFRALVGFPKFWDAEMVEALGELQGARRDGMRVVMIEGNRDFFLDLPELDPYRDAAVRVHSFAAGGRRFLLEHGDLVNVRDRQYRFWRALSKSHAARLWARLLPERVARRIVSGTERRLAETNFTYRRRPPEEQLRANARSHFATGVGVVLWGHFHDPWAFRGAGGLAAVVPAWGETGVVVFVDEAGRMLVSEPGGTGGFVDTPFQSWYQDHERRTETR